jgi:hypothetical protein
MATEYQSGFTLFVGLSRSVPYLGRGRSLHMPSSLSFSFLLRSAQMHWYMARARIRAGHRRQTGAYMYSMPEIFS